MKIAIMTQEHDDLLHCVPISGSSLKGKTYCGLDAVDLVYVETVSRHLISGTYCTACQIQANRVLASDSNKGV